MILSHQCAVVGGIFCHRSLSAILRRKIGKPRKELRNLNGFEYMYLSDLKNTIFLVIILHIRKGYFHGHNTLSLHGKTCAAMDEQTETGSKRLHLQLTQM